MHNFNFYDNKMNTKFNYEFKLRDFEGTKTRHLGQVQKIKADKEMSFNNIMGSYTEDNIISYLFNDGHYYFESWFKGKEITKTLLRSLKCLVNTRYRYEIENTLKWNEKPISWATAFYVVNYKKINAEMKAITKEIIKNYI